MWCKTSIFSVKIAPATFDVKFSLQTHSYNKHVNKNISVCQLEKNLISLDINITIINICK